jgi:hypothetical protein
MRETAASLPTTAGQDALMSEHALVQFHAGALGYSPCGYLVIDNFLRPDVAACALQEIQAFEGRWSHRRHQAQSKRVFTRHSSMPATVREIVTLLNGEGFIQWVETVSGIGSLRPDPDLEGAGLCEMRSGDFMRPHRDSASHVARPRWRRQHALFIFLNPDWKAEYGGNLTLWQPGSESGIVSILPLFNRFVLFADPAGVFHGVPEIQCPSDMARRSISVYYYVEQASALPLQPTTYRDPSANGRVPAWTERVNQSLVWLYFALRRYLRPPR